MKKLKGFGAGGGGGVRAAFQGIDRFGRGGKVLGRKLGS